ncbi:MAG: PAS domain S-box protein [Candidatus Cloacimonetes bacterium]|nr:PAS domain S-box protein [Candidatus Cloacimonadota bacterium]
MKGIDKMFRSFAENNEDLVIFFNPALKINYVNPAYGKLFGISADKLQGRSFLPFIAEDDRSRIQRILESIDYANPSTRHQERAITINGVKWLEWVVKGIFSKQGKLENLFGIGRDITNNKILEDDLRSIKKRYQNGEIVGGVGNWEFDLTTGNFWGSSGAIRLYGFPPDRDTLTAEEVESRIPDRDRVHQALIDLIERETPYDLEFEILPLDREEPRIIKSQAVVERDIDDKPLKVTGVIQDITHQKAAEENLRLSEERFKLAVEGSRDGLWDWNLITNKAYHSDRFATMLGYEPDELPYTSVAWSELLHPDDKKKAFQTVEDYLQGKTKEYESTFRMKCKDGYYRWISGRGKAIRDENGKPYRFVGFNTDITKRKNVEGAYLKSEERFHKLNDSLAEGVFLFNDEGKIIDANQAAQDILGLSTTELKNRFSTLSISRLFHEDGSQYSDADNPVIKSLRNGETCRNVIMGFINPRKKGDVWISVNSTPIYEGNRSQPINAYAIFEDVTEIRKSEQKLQELQAELSALKSQDN